MTKADFSDVEAELEAKEVEKWQRSGTKDSFDLWKYKKNLFFSVTVFLVTFFLTALIFRFVFTLF